MAGVLGEKGIVTHHWLGLQWMKSVDCKVVVDKYLGEMLAEMPGDFPLDSVH